MQMLCGARPGWLVSRTDCRGFAPEDTGYGYEAGGACDRLSPPGPHSALMPGPVLIPPLSPCAPQGEPSSWPEDPRQRACLTGAQVRELLHSELPRDANDQEQVGLGARWAETAVVGSFFPPPPGPGAAGVLTPPHQASGRPGTLSDCPLTHPRHQTLEYIRDNPVSPNLISYFHVVMVRGQQSRGCDEE